MTQKVFGSLVILSIICSEAIASEPAPLATKASKDADWVENNVSEFHVFPGVFDDGRAFQAGQSAPDVTDKVSWQAYWDRADKCISKGEFRNALSLLNLALGSLASGDPEEQETINLVVSLALKLGDVGEYKKVLRRLGKPLVWTVYIDDAEAFCARGDKLTSAILIDLALRELPHGGTYIGDKKKSESLRRIASLCEKIDDNAREARCLRYLHSCDTDGYFIDDSTTIEDLPDNSLIPMMKWADRLAYEGGQHDTVARMKLRESERLYRNVLSYASNCPDLRARTVNRLCRFLLSEKRYADCEKLIKTEQLATQPNDTMHSAFNLVDLALFNEGQSNLEASDALLEKAKIVFIESLGPSHPKSISTLVDLGRVAAKSGDSTRALKLYEQAYSGLKEQSRYGARRKHDVVRAYSRMLRDNEQEDLAVRVEKLEGLDKEDWNDDGGWVGEVLAQ